MVFGALAIVPGDPVQLLMGLDNNPELHKALEHQLGLDKPPLTRFALWLLGILHGDFGTSISKSASVSQLIASRLPVTVPLVLASSVLALLIAIPAGVFAARRRGKFSDLTIVALTQAGLAVPSFWLGLLLAILFAVKLHWLPANGWEAWSSNPIKSFRFLLLPVLTLALGQAAGLVRMVRGGVLDVLGQDYVRTARGKGLEERVVLEKHVLKNALVNVLTLLGLQVGQLLAGAIVVESVFDLPGLGRLALDAVKASDFPLVQGVVLCIAATIVLVNFLVDVGYGALDPRIRFD